MNIGNLPPDVEQIVNQYKVMGYATRTQLIADAIKALRLQKARETRSNGLVTHGVDAELAQRIGELPVIGNASDIVLIAERAGVSVEQAAEAFFGVASQFDLFRIIEEGRTTARLPLSLPPDCAIRITN